MATWWLAVLLLALLVAIVGLGGIGAGVERSDLSLICLGLGLALLSVTYFYHRRPDKAEMPRFALVLGTIGLAIFVIAAFLSQDVAGR